MGKSLVIKNVNFSDVAFEKVGFFSAPTIEITGYGQVSIFANSLTIHYTTDGTTPTINSAVYTAPFIVTVGTTVKAISTSDGQISSVVSKSFEFEIMTNVIENNTLVVFPNGDVVLDMTPGDSPITLFIPVEQGKTYRVKKKQVEGSSLSSFCRVCLTNTSNDISSSNLIIETTIIEVREDYYLFEFDVDNASYSYAAIYLTSQIPVTFEVLSN